MQLLRKHIFYLSKLCYIAAAPSSRIHWQWATCTCIMTAWSRWLVTNCISQYSIEFTHWFSLLNCWPLTLIVRMGMGHDHRSPAIVKKGLTTRWSRRSTPNPKNTIFDSTGKIRCQQLWTSAARHAAWPGSLRHGKQHATNGSRCGQWRLMWSVCRQSSTEFS